MLNNLSLTSHGWPAAAVVLILVLARAAKAPAIGSPLARIPVRYRPHVVGLLGVLSGILEAVVAGVPWHEAIPTGVLSAAVAIAVHGWVGGLAPKTPTANPVALPIEADPEPEGAIIETTITDIPAGKVAKVTLGEEHGAP